jgi:hypothetical protein
MLEQRDDFLQRLEHDLPPIEWADADAIRRHGQTHRRRRRTVQVAGALVAALALGVVGTTVRTDHTKPAPIKQLEGVQLSPDLCEQPLLVTALGLQSHPCATTSTPGEYLDAGHGLNVAHPFAVTLPQGWSFQSLAPHGMGSQVDLVADDGTQGIRISVYVGSANGGKRLDIESRAQLLNALQAIPGLAVSKQTRVLVGGLPAIQVDITGSRDLPAAKADCFIGTPCYPVFQQVPVSRLAPPVYTVGATPGTTSRLILPARHGDVSFPATLIWIWDTNPSSGFQVDLQRAQPIVDSLNFIPPSE